MLLEESLTANTGNGSQSPPPSETAFALLSFLRDELPAGGIAAERRFVHLFPLIMERCFGRLLPHAADSSSHVSNGGEEAASYRHDANGWLSMSFPPRSLQNYSSEDDPIVRLLRAPRCLSLDGGANNASGESRQNGGAWPTLLDAVTAESHGVLLDYPLYSLETREMMNRWKDCLARRLDTVATASVSKPSADRGNDRSTKHGTSNVDNIIRLLPEQTKLRAYFAQQATQNHRRAGGTMSHDAANAHNVFGSPFAKSYGGSPRSSPRIFQSNNLQSSPSAAGIKNPKDGGDGAGDKTLQLRLTMLQYYFFVFFRFPILQQKQVMSSSSSSGARSTIRQRASDYGSTLYSYLFASYLRYYLPTGNAVTNASTLPPASELFLRLLMEFWLDLNPVSTTEEAVGRYVAVRGASPTLREALELSRVCGDRFRTLPSKVQRGILATVRHFVSDLGLRESVKGASALIQERQQREKEGTTDDADNVQVWCIPPAMTVVQPLLLNYIRVGLACGSIHDKDSSFHKALEVWLLWLEPWNYVVKKRIHPSNSDTGGGAPRQLIRAAQNVAANVGHATNVEYYPYYVAPKPTSRSAYTPQWEAYVAANVHFYTVPLAIFLRRARELEFSSATEFYPALLMVQRVLRCYPKPIVNILNFVLNSRADAVTNGIVLRHGEVLGPYLPPDDWKLSSCQIDATNLLDDIFVQYEKRERDRNFLDRFEAKIATLFSGNIGSEEANLQSILSQLKCLVGLPLEYQVPIEVTPKRSLESWFPFLGKASTDTQVDWIGPERTADGLLTDLGRRQISTGTRKCSPFDVRYIGDPMLAPYQSYEVPALVDLTIVLSNYLNYKLGFVPWPSLAEEADKDEDILTKNIREMKRYNAIVFRLNLRFLADYRNVLALSFVIWIVRKLA